jgi:hypothetical protein
MSEFKWDDQLVCEFTYGNSNLSYNEINERLEAFKKRKQPKPEWEIVAFKHRGMIATIMDSEGYSQPHFQCPGQQFGLDWALEGHDCSIHSVKRLSDGEVFTVGGIVYFEGIRHRISGFEINDGFMEMVFEMKLRGSLKNVMPIHAETVPVLLTPAQIEKLKTLLK